MINFRERAWIPERMDDLDLGEKDLALALSDIRRVNRLLGGHAASSFGLKPFLIPASSIPLTILDVGCGDGTFLRVLAGYCRSQGIKAEFIGWDMNPKCLEIARTASVAFPEIRFECRNVLDLPALPENSHVVCNLFLHHFRSPDIARLLGNWIKQKPRLVLINDLHRHPLAYYLFWFFGAIFMKSAVARHDGAASIRRSFSRVDLENLGTAIPEVKISIRWRWAFRWLCCIEPK